MAGLAARLSDQGPAAPGDLRFPAYGFGGASVGNLNHASTEEEAASAMAAALTLGFCYFDTAPYYGYGLSETRIGRFLARHGEKDILLSTKVGRLLVPAGPAGSPPGGFVDPLPFEPVFDYSYDGIMRSFDESCARLGVERVDILYMHDLGAATHGPEAHPPLFKLAMDGGYRAMASLKADGRVKAIGLGVNEWEVCQQSFACANFDIFMLAGRYTLIEQSPLDTFFPECARRGVGVVVAGPMNSGLLARRPDARSRYNYAEAPPHLIEHARRLFDFCAEHGIPAQAAAIQFPLLHPVVRCVVSGMSSAARVEEAHAWAQVRIPPNFWTALKEAGLLRADAPVEDLVT